MSVEEIRQSLPASWGVPRIGSAPYFSPGAVRRMGVNWNGDESIDRLQIEIGPRDVLGCAVFLGDTTSRVYVWVRA